MKRIYLDNAALTPIDKDVAKVMAKYSTMEFGNPSSLYLEGVKAKKILAAARKRVANAIFGLPDEIIFTSSGTEANNLAINGLTVWLAQKRKKINDLHLLVSKIEHASVLECARWLEKQGVIVEYIGVDENGIIDLKELKEKIRPTTFLVSVMAVNNEIGTIQPLVEIAKIVRHARKTNAVLSEVVGGGKYAFPYFHTDACQAPLYLTLDTRKIGADFLVLDGQKMYGPRGTGMLWMRRGVEINPILLGGGQEHGMRSGTENMPAIYGFTVALEKAVKNHIKEARRLAVLRDYCIEKLLTLSPEISVNGSRISRIANNVSISFSGLVDTEFLVLQLDARGIACSTKSSCLRDENESYVVRALGKSSHQAQNSIRFTFGRDTRKSDINYLLRVLKTLISRVEK